MTTIINHLLMMFGDVFLQLLAPLAGDAAKAAGAGPEAALLVRARGLALQEGEARPPRLHLLVHLHVAPEVVRLHKP